MRKISIRYQVSSIKGFVTAFLLFFGLLLTTYYLLPTVYAQTTPCGTSSTFRATGLVSAPSITSGSKFNTSSGACAVDPKAAFIPFQIPTYDDLKSLYYTQSKANKPSSITSLPATISDQTVYTTPAGTDLTVSSTPSGGGTAIIFVEGNLNFNTQNYTYGTGTTGTIFVVKGDVNIDPAITGIDATIISAGNIYTAGANCAVNSVSASALTINGSLISLNPDTATPHIKFCRTLASNISPSEIINNQPKYLVLLRSLLSQSIQKWSEIGPDVEVPVIPASDYSISPVSSQTINYGSSVTANITASIISGPIQAVTYSISGLPNGVTGTFSPPSCTPNPNCNVILTLSAASTVSTSTQTVTITGSAGTASKSTSFTLTVNGFNFSIPPVSNIITSPGDSMSTTVTASLTGGLTQPVSFSITSILPTGVTASFLPTSCSPTCSSTLNIQTSASTPIGNYPMTITGQGGGLTRIVNSTLSVNTFNFSLKNSGTVTVSQGQSSTETITVSLLSGSGNVSFSVSGLPSGVTGSFSPTSCSPNPSSCTSTLTLTAGATVPTGSYPPITVTGTSGGTSNTTSFGLIISSPFDYSITCANVVVTAGGTSSSSNITTKVLSGNPQTITFSGPGFSPSATGITASYTKNPITAGQLSGLVVAASSSTAPQNYTMKVTGTSSGGIVRNGSCTLTVNPPPSWIYSTVFSTTQNTNQLSYYGKDTNTGAYSLASWTGSKWFVSGADPNFSIVNGGMAPAWNYDSVVRWRPPQNGSITISGYFNRCCTTFTNVSPYTVYYVAKNGTNLWSESVTSTATLNHSYNFTTTVTTSDTIDFGANANWDSGWDGTSMDFTISYN